MIRQLLKSKIHRASVTGGNVQYEGSITIPEDLIQAAGLWEGEKVLVASIASGERLETYVQKGPAGSGAIVMNGAAALRIRPGDRVTILAFGHSESPIAAKVVHCNERNEITAPAGPGGNRMGE